MLRLLPDLELCLELDLERMSSLSFSNILGLPDLLEWELFPDCTLLAAFELVLDLYDLKLALESDLQLAFEDLSESE